MKEMILSLNPENWRVQIRILMILILVVVLAVSGVLVYSYFTIELSETSHTLQEAVSQFNLGDSLSTYEK